MKVTPILLLTGYLGSGKTTLVNHIITNTQGIRFAVIVNDIGEVNIDADLIQKGGVVGKKDESLVALQNGCICCTLKMDLVEQLYEIVKTHRFDYIVIEASGICEPVSIAQTICSIPSMGREYTRDGLCQIDSIVTVVDALRLKSEFGCGNELVRTGIEDEDIENLLIQQMEFCNTILLNKVSEVNALELGRIRQIISHIQPRAEIIECDYANILLSKIINTGKFNFDRVAGSAGWISELEKPIEHEHEHEQEQESEHEHEHEEGYEKENGHEHRYVHEHNHNHNHNGGEAEEYGISTFVYYRRPAFDINKFDHFIAKKWSANIIRAKGICYFSDNPDMSYLFEQAGVQKQLKEIGQWYATAPEDELRDLLRQEPDLLRDWDPMYGDRMQKIVFIGQHLDKQRLALDLDACLDS